MSTTRNLPPEGTKRTAGRKKTTTDIGRQVLNRERRRMAREQASESEEMVAEYRRQAERRAMKLEDVDSPQRKMIRAIDRGLVKRVAGVLASEDLTFTMETSPSHDARSSAWTDFRTISVTYGVFTDAKSEPDYRMIAANFRGLAYHEGGHIRWTIPFRNLVEMVTGEQNTNRYDNLHKAWNILEDQRMETAVVSDSPVKAKYLLPMVMEHNCPTLEMLGMNYPYIVWRKYLPAKLRRQGRALFLRTHPLMTEALCTEMENIIERYVMADEAVEMWNAINEFDLIYRNSINPSIPEDETHQMYKREGDMEDMLQIPISPDMIDETEDGDEQGEGGKAEGGEDSTPGEAEGGEDASKGEGDEDEGTPSKGMPGEEDDSKDGEPGGEGAGTTSPDEQAPGEMSQGDLDAMKQEAEDVRNNDRNLDGDELAMQEAAQEFGSTLPIYSTGVNTDSELQARADNLAYEVENSFHAATMDKAPAWVEQQNRGVLNVMRYETREPGQTDFYRQWTDDDQPGFNIAVSVLLDYSGSMAGKTEDLAASGYATKLACERLGVPCTVTLWNTNAMLLWDHHDKADYIPLIQADGGTNPRVAMDDLFAQRFEKPVHIVLIMTDGSWNGSTDFTDYRTEGTHFIVLSYDKELSTANRRAALIDGMGADVSLGINDLMQIPRVLEQALADAVLMAP